MTNPDSAGGLLPCPFCGSAAERIDFGVGSGDNEGGSCIACTKCQASGPVEFGYKENFVSNWNRRAAIALMRGQSEDEVLVALKRPEGYEDVHPELVAEDAIRPEWPSYRTITTPKDSADEQ